MLNRGRIDLSKTSWTVTEKLIEFLYTGTVESTFLERRGVDLFLASHTVCCIFSMFNHSLLFTTHLLFTVWH